jgi:hypothetical protein
MKKLIMTVTAVAMFAPGPAFAGCGSHGGGYSRSYAAPASYAKPRYSTTSRSVAARATSRAKVAAKADPLANDASSEAGKGKPAAPQAPAQSVQTASADNTSSLPAQPAAQECKKYSATIGAMISVACE